MTTACCARPMPRRGCWRPPAQWANCTCSPPRAATRTAATSAWLRDQPDAVRADLDRAVPLSLPGRPRAGHVGLCCVSGRHQTAATKTRRAPRGTKVKRRRKTTATKTRRAPAWAQRKRRRTGTLPLIPPRRSKRHKGKRRSKTAARRHEGTKGTGNLDRGSVAGHPEMSRKIREGDFSRLTPLRLRVRQNSEFQAFFVPLGVLRVFVAKHFHRNQNKIAAGHLPRRYWFEDRI